MTSYSKTFPATLIASLLLTPALSGADDTEIFFSPSTASGGDKSNILFMVDTSGSMRHEDGMSLKRITRVKRAMIDVVNSGDNFNLGIGRFNGEFKGGAILVPPVGMDEDRCVNASCASITLSSRISNREDDAEELADGTMKLNSTTIDFTRDYADAAITSADYTIQSGTDDVVQSSTGALITNAALIDFFYDGTADPVTAGLRFNNINLAPGSTVISAIVNQEVPWNEGKGAPSARIRLDSTTASPTFADVAGQRINDRPVLSDAIQWEYILDTNVDGRLVATPDIAMLVQQRIDMTDWAVGHPLTFLFDVGGDQINNADEGRKFKSFEAVPPKPAILSLQSTTDNILPGSVGLRFDNLNIPRGATITNAVIKVMTADVDSTPSAFVISAHDIGDAQSFDNTNTNISSRTRTTATVNWSPAPFQGSRLPESTADISSIVQEISDRTDWCGGNAMAFIIEGDGRRRARSYDDNAWNAAVLDVTYEPGTVDFTSSCVNRQITAAVQSGIDDIAELTTTGVIDAGSPISDGNTSEIGLRFANLQVPKDALINSAYLQIFSGGKLLDDTTSINIEAIDSDNATDWDPATNNDLSGRATTAAIQWENVGAVEKDAIYYSSDIGSLVSQVVSKAGWAEGNAFSLKLSGAAVSRLWNMHESGMPAKLLVNYKQVGLNTDGSTPVLETGRQALIQAIHTMQPNGSTPIVDSYYEAAAYFTGSPVHYGKQRGDATRYYERYFMLSGSDTYTGGSVFRPSGCNANDLTSHACIGERINGNPVYAPPVKTECGSNQIVLLSDGSATVNTSKDKVRELTSVTACATRSTTDEECGVELAGWLNSTDHDTSVPGEQNIRTHTVGFNFSTGFLKEIARDGGGEFYTANTSGELVSVFSSIVRKSAAQNTSFVAPAVTLSQSNRLNHSDDLYFGMFRPTATEKWHGNLKKFRFVADAAATGGVKVGDQAGNAAFDPATGQISETARSFWSAAADGADVAAGGAASKLPAIRNLKTALTSISGSKELVEFHESNADITYAMLNIATGAVTFRENLLKWARGVDKYDQDLDGSIVDVRTQMGDPLHSAPQIVNYADRSLVFIATNEGFLHAINAETGIEEFGFIPEELLPNLIKFHDNEPMSERVYGLDGHITTWIDDQNRNGKVDGSEKAYLIVGMRRGGRSYYAFDISDPDQPELAWQIQGGTGDFAELAQTWSKPVKTRLQIGATKTDVLIFAAGYDQANDTKLQRAPDSIGRGIYIVNAATGALIAKRTAAENASLQYSMASTIRVIDINLDSLADTMFVGDMGGQVWRFDYNNSGTGTAASNLTGGVIAELGGTDVTANRKFFSEPDVALVRDDYGTEFYTVSIGSGWRAHPLDAIVEDRLYVLKDRAVYGPPLDSGDSINYAAAKVYESNLFNATNASGRTDTSGKIDKGWFIELETAGEKVLSKATTASNAVFFTSYLPDTGISNTCSVGIGSGRVWALDVVYADAVQDLDDSGSSGLDISDRFRNLKTPGIPPSVSVLLPKASPDTPVVTVGTEVLPKLDSGDLFKRTFWAEY